jgi:hypothetical protein
MLSARGGFASNAAAWWGFHCHDLIAEPTPRQVITIYEMRREGEQNWARAVYTFRWTPQTDPFGVVHPLMDHLACRPMPRRQGQTRRRSPALRQRADQLSTPK